LRKPNDKKTVGRISKYDPKIHNNLAKWLARDGYTQEQIADRFEINPSTLQRWIKDNPNLKESLKKGKEEVRYEVEDSLIKRAMGYEYEKTEIEVFRKGGGKKKNKDTTPVKARDGLMFGKMDEKTDNTDKSDFDEVDKAEYIKKKITVVHVPGDVTAQIFYLKTQWKDKYGDQLIDLTKQFGEAAAMTAKLDELAQLEKQARGLNVGPT